MKKILILFSLLISCNLQALRFENLRVEKVKKIKVKKEATLIENIAFDPNKKILATRCKADSKIKFFNLSDVNKITYKELDTKSSWQQSFAFSPCGEKFFVINRDKLSEYNYPSLKKEKILLDFKEVSEYLDKEEEEDETANHCRGIFFGRELRTWPWSLVVRKLPTSYQFIFPYNQFSILLYEPKNKFRKLKRYTSAPTCNDPFYVTLSPNENLLASTTRDNSVYLWLGISRSIHLVASRGIELHKGKKGDWIARCVTFSPNGDFLAAASYCGIVRLWDLSRMHNGKPLCHELKGHEKTSTFVSFSPNGKLLASSSFDGTIRLWDLSSLGKRHIILEENKKCVRFVLFISDTLFVSCHDDSIINIWQLYEEEESEEDEGEIVDEIDEVTKKLLDYLSFLE